MGEQISRKLSNNILTVPYGLPVLPPHWVFTINIWTYDIVGSYQAFSVIDNDNEVIPNPYFGHEGQMYVRTDEHINYPSRKNEDGSSIWIGSNKQIFFQFDGYSATIVGPGPKGVGDKKGGSTEKSAGYDTLVSELGAKT
jgi:hypothetical protein